LHRPVILYLDSAQSVSLELYLIDYIVEEYLVMTMFNMTTSLHKMTESLAEFSCYLPIEPDAAAWGLHVLDAGLGVCAASTAYPARGQHPDKYMFTWENGRELAEYQLIYISRGQGVFETRESGPHQVRAGSLLLLFPGVWHRYRPDLEFGWEEQWVGFQGTYAAQLMATFFSVTPPVLQLGYDPEFLRLLGSICDLAYSDLPGHRQMMAAYTTAALACARSLAMRERAEIDHHERKMQQARTFLLERATSTVDLPSLAQELGYSYSRFRAVFKKTTGLSPRQYQLQICINRAKHLLTRSEQSISAIADMLGFGSVYYFSRQFKAKTGVSPTHFRRTSSVAARRINY